MATESRRVRCKSCGYEWDSTADDPRCPDPDNECGRARAEEIGDTSDSGSQEETESGTDDSDTSGDTADDSDGLFFNVSQERTGNGDGSTDAPTAPSTDDSDDEDDEDDEDDDGSIDAPDLEPEDIRPMFVFAFGSQDEEIPGFLSNRRGDHWGLKEHELDQLSQAWTRVGNKYLPYLLAEYTVEGMALLSTAMIMAPRIQEDRRRAELRKKRERDTEPDTGETRTSSSDESEESVEELIDEEASTETDEGGSPSMAINRA